MVDSWWMVRAACWSASATLKPCLNLCNTPVTVLQLKYFVSYIAAAAIEAILSIWMMQRTWDRVSLCKSSKLCRSLGGNEVVPFLWLRVLEEKRGFRLPGLPLPRGPRVRLPHVKVNVGVDQAKTALKADSERDLENQRIHQRYSIILQ